MTKDPVCGMTVDPAKARASLAHAGKTYYFCSNGCRDKFAADPARWLKKAAEPIAAGTAVGDGKPALTAVEWTCPMHPQIVRSGPGTCPICGMALEPRTPTADHAENAELRDMSRRFWTAVILSVPIFSIAMTEFLPGGDMGGLISMRAKTWICCPSRRAAAPSL